jgi:hypothetical protein
VDFDNIIIEKMLDACQVGQREETASRREEGERREGRGERGEEGDREERREGERFSSRQEKNRRRREAERKRKRENKRKQRDRPHCSLLRALTLALTLLPCPLSTRQQRKQNTNSLLPHKPQSIYISER